MTKRETQLLKELREIKERLAEIEKHVAAQPVNPYPVYSRPWPYWPPWGWPYPITWSTGTITVSNTAGNYATPLSIGMAGSAADPFAATEVVPPITLT